VDRNQHALANRLLLQQEIVSGLRQVTIVNDSSKEMKRIIQLVVVVTAIVILAFHQKQATLERIAADQQPKSMFVETDGDDFNPGIDIGSTFPSLTAVYKDRTIHDLQPFVAKKGMVFFASRSVDW
jgi:hypothetical protein